MYKLGQGSHPPYPEKLVDDEASCFLDMCFKFNPDERATTGQLLAHPFVKVSLTLLYFIRLKRALQCSATFNATKKVKIDVQFFEV